jgi:hypothetical protein
MFHVSIGSKSLWNNGFIIVQTFPIVLLVISLLFDVSKLQNRYYNSNTYTKKDLTFLTNPVTLKTGGKFTGTSITIIHPGKLFQSSPAPTSVHKKKVGESPTFLKTPLL